MPERSLLLDSTALIDLYRGRRSLLSLLEDLLQGEVLAFYSVISEAELWRGVQPHEIDRHKALLDCFTPLPLAPPQLAWQVAGCSATETRDWVGWML